jgi:hypothetical protein
MLRTGSSGLLTLQIENETRSRTIRTAVRLESRVSLTEDLLFQACHELKRLGIDPKDISQASDYGTICLQIHYGK